MFVSYFRSPGAVRLFLGVFPLLVACSAAETDDAAAGELSSNASLSEGAGLDEGSTNPLGGASPLSPTDGHDDLLSAGGASASATSSCLSLMSWGAMGQWGAVPGEGGEDAIVAWLNQKSSIQAEHFKDQPEITAEFLAGYDLILLQDLSRWSLSQIELDLFESWVREGGGVFALSGYEKISPEKDQTNALLSFSAMNYVGQSETWDTASVLGACAYCLSSTYQQAGFIPDHPIAQGVRSVGAFRGRSIRGDGEVVAKDGVKNLAMSKSIDKGRLFLFHDDWISFRELWTAPALSSCVDNMECRGISPASTYQIPQFWSNALRWLAADPSCFILDDPAIVR